jgi:hypothetical protein
MASRRLLETLGTNRHTLGALPSQTRAQILGTLAVGGGSTLIPAQGGAVGEQGTLWT